MCEQQLYSEHTLAWKSEELRSIVGLQDILDAIKDCETFDWGIYVVSDDIEHTGILLTFDVHEQVKSTIVCIDVSSGKKGAKWASKNGHVYPLGHHHCVGIHDWERLQGLDYYVLKRLSMGVDVQAEELRDMIEIMLQCDPGKYNLITNNCRDHVLRVLQQLCESGHPCVQNFSGMKKVIADLKGKDWKEFRKRLDGLLKRR